MVYPLKERQQRSQTQSPVQFSYPGENFIKLNFDGASKGNPGSTGYGGIFRDSERHTRWVYADWGGIMTNNEAELIAVYQGLRIAVRNGYTKLEIEGDSQVVVEMLRNLNNGKDWDQVAKSWRTTGIIQDLADILKRIEYKIINHVR